MSKFFTALAASSALIVAACSGGSDKTYALSSEQVVAKLLKADARIVGFGGNVSVSSPESNMVLWTMTSSHAALQCTATTTAVSASESTVATNCSGSSPSDGAAEGSLVDMVNILVEEHVAATLLDRPFDGKKAEMAMVSSFAKNLPAMQRDALQMDGEAKIANQELAELAEGHEDAIVGEAEDSASFE
jgi:hypothetical protein